MPHNMANPVCTQPALVDRSQSDKRIMHTTKSHSTLYSAHHSDTCMEGMIELCAPAAIATHGHADLQVPIESFVSSAMSFTLVPEHVMVELIHVSVKPASFSTVFS